MAEPKDILLDADYGLLVKNGDLVIGECEAQNIDLLCRTQEGQWRTSPLSGIGVVRWLKSTFTAKKMQQFKRRIKQKLEFDGYAEVELTSNQNNDININATR